MAGRRFGAPQRSCPPPSPARPRPRSIFPLLQVVSVQLPRNFSGKVREHLLADPSVVRLRDRSPYFYEVGLGLAAMVAQDDAVTLPTAVRVALAARMSGILDHSMNSLREDVSTYSSQLTEFERALFTGGLMYAMDRDAWKRKAAARIQASSVVISTQRAAVKRRREQD